MQTVPRSGMPWKLWKTSGTPSLPAASCWRSRWKFRKSSIENYEILYRGNLPEGKHSVPQAELLEQLYQKFNCASPTDYHGHSLSVSDVIMLNQDGKISAHYVDSIGFKELPGFLDKKPKRPSVLMNLKEKCDAPECNPTVCRKARDEHEL
ncbi:MULTISPECIES: YodL domain-containing protein [Faecalibacterium]|nr:YodL domain-containing protein [Faecalibacterium sp. I4-3-84]